MKFRNGIEKKEEYIRKTDRSNKGYTLIETLIVVGIIAVLLLVSTLGITKYLRGMKQIEMDNAAKEIFIAAQNHLSTADSQGYLDRDEDSANIGTLDNTTTNYKNKDVYYYIVKNGKTDTNLNNTGSFINLMLPTGAVDETVRTGGSYIICFQKETAKVLDVFYAENNSRYKHTFDKEEYATLMEDYRDVDGVDKKKERKKYSEDESVIGYYGGDDVGIPEGEKLSAPKIKVVNDDRLCVEVTNPNKDWKVENAKGGNYSAELKLLITGETSGNTKEIILSDSGNGESAYLASLFADTIEYEVEDEKNINTYTIVLDDVTTKSTDGENRHFSSLFCGAGENALLAGEDITVQATAQSTVAFTNIASSGKQTINSLFADYDKDENIAYISSIRHLENIDYDISGIDVIDFPVEKAEQMTNLTWSGFRNNIKLGNEFFISKSDGSKRTLEKDCFSPIKNINREKNTVALDYDGKNHYLSGFKIYEKGGAGVFEELVKDSKVQNLQIINFDVESTDGNAGALAASTTQTDIKNILVRNNLKLISEADESKLEVTAKLNAGGLVGTADGGKVDETAAAVYVKSTDGNAGGLIGTIKGTVLKHSYSGGHTNAAQFLDVTEGNDRINVQSKEKSGGLVGESLSGSEIEFCYSTCSAKGATAGGLVGNINGGKIENSYASGKMFSNSEDVETGAFVGKFTDSTKFNNDKYVENMSDNSRKEEIEGVTGIVGQSTEDTDFIIDEENKSQAAAYDPMLVVSYKGKYSFPTIKMMDSGKTGESSFLKYHYGDWQIPELVPVDFRLINNDTLSLQIDLENTKDFVYTVIVEGLESHAIKVLHLQLKDGKPSIIKEGISTGGAVTWSEYVSDWTTSLVEAVEENPARVNIVLDDITSTAKNHFCELFPNHYAGENIGVKVVGGELENVKATKEIESVYDNSLFATVSENNIGTAYITYIRHLQNLDSRVSNVNDAVTQAKLLCALRWDANKYPVIYNYGHTVSVTNSFYGIYNNNLVLFDGNNCELDDFVINGAVDFGNGMGVGNAGLFRYVVSPLIIKDLRINDCAIKAKEGNAGTVVAEVENVNNVEVSINSVLVTSAKYEALVTSGNYSGGIVGKAETPITINNCASSVMVYGTDAAGGLVGLIDTTEGISSISSSYVGGHTVNAKYSDREYNITSGGGAGGIVGGVNSGSLNVIKTFSAASVIGETAGGGIIGEVNSNASLTDTYTIATVKGVAAEKAGAESSVKDGAVAGVLTGVLTAEKCYYLDELYPGHELDADKKSNVPYVGTGKEKITGNIEPSSYQEDDGKTNNISARTMGEMQDATEVYDSYLNGKEYPYMIWTKFTDWNSDLTFDFDSMESGNSSSQKKSVYYGDWQPELEPESELISVTFYNEKPDVSGGVTTERVKDKHLGIQKILYNRDNTILAPEAAKVKGYEVEKWVLTSEDNPGISRDVELKIDQGFIIIDKEYCKEDIIVVAKYKKIEDQAVIRFMYDDPTDEQTKWVQLGSDREVKKGTDISEVSVPQKDYYDYRMVGWYSDKSCVAKSKLDFSDGTVDGDIIAYAKYEQMDYFYVYLDFYYQIDDEQSWEMLPNIPLYSLDMERPQYVFKLSLDDGEIFDKDIDLPNLDKTVADGDDPVVVGAYDEENNEFIQLNGGDIAYNKTSNKVHIKTDKTSNYFVLFKVKSAKSYKYKVNYIFDDTDANSSISLDSETNGIIDDSGLKYKKDSLFTHSSEVRTYAQGLIPDISKVSLNLNDGWSRSTKKVELLPAGEGADVDYYINVEYKRNDYALTFDCRSGTYIEPVKLTYGQSLSSVKPQSNPTRKGYSFDSWAIHSKTAIENPIGSYQYVSKDGEAENYSWNSTMPDKNMIATAKWNPGKSKYRVMYWYEDVLGGGYVHQHTIDCFQQDAVSFNKEEIYYNSCSFDYEYKDKKTISEEIKISIQEGETKTASNGTNWVGNKQFIETQTGTWQAVYNGNVVASGTCSRTRTYSVGGLSGHKYYDSYTDWSDTTSGTKNYAGFTKKSRSDNYYVTVEIEVDDLKSQPVNFGGLDTDNKTGVQEFTTTDSIYIEKSGTDKVYCKYSNGEWYVCDSSGNLSGTKITVVQNPTGTYKYKYNSRDIIINIASVPQDTMIYEWNYKNETEIHKCIYLNGTFYNYTGDTPIGEKAQCSNSEEGGDSGFNYVGSIVEEGTTDSIIDCSKYKSYLKSNNTSITEDWIDKNNFTYNEEMSDKNVQIKPDGSTIVNVYFKRNEYTLTFKVNGNTIKTIKALYEADIHNEFPILGTDKVSYLGYYWEEEGQNKLYDQKLQTLDRMPGKSITFKGTYRGTNKMILYYLERLPNVIYSGEGVTKNNRTYPYLINIGDSDASNLNKDFYLYKSVLHDFNYLTDKEEFHTIYGFNKYGYYTGTNKLAEKLNGSIEWDRNNVTKFFYSRKSYNLEFYLKGETNPFKTATVLYEKNLKEYSNIRPETSPGEDYVFDGFYKDPGCTQPVNLANKNMPAGHIAVYCKWIAPIRTVNFYTDNTLGTKISSVEVEKETTLDGIITDASGDLLSAYKPGREGYFFEGWYYMDGSAEKPFIYSQQIINNMDVYAKWTVDEDADQGNNDVTVRYLLGEPEDYENKEPSDEDRVAEDEIITDSSIGKTIMIKAKNIQGYYSNDMLKYHKVSKESKDNVITFYYKVGEPWNYDIEYYVTFNSLDDSTMKDPAVLEDGITEIDFTNKESYLADSVKNAEAYNRYETISFQLPDSLEGYHLDHYEYEGEKGSGNTAIIHPNENGTGTIKYYLAIDSDDLYVEDRYAVYDGISQAKVSAKTTEIGKSGVTVQSWNLYTYYTFDGQTKLDKKDVVDAGTYTINGYIIYCVNGIAEGDSLPSTKYFLIYKDETKNLKLRVEKRSIVIESASATKKYDGKPLTACRNSDIKITATDGGEISALVTNAGNGEKDGLKIIFSVEAFRLNPGTTENSFTYKAKGNTNLNNYFIITKFGNLTVTE